MPARALAKTERVTGSSLPIVLLQYERAYTINHAPPPWPDNASGLPELDYGRTLYFGTLAHLLTVQHRHLHPLPVEVGLPLSGPGVAPRLGLCEFRLFDRDRGDKAQVNELDDLVLHVVAVALLVRGVEAMLQLLKRVGLHGQLEGLAPVAEIGPARVFGSVEVSFCLALHLREPTLELISVHFVEGREVGAHVVAADVRDGEAEGGEDTAGTRDEDGLHAQLLSEGAGVHPAGPAEGEQGELPRVQAALDADDPERARHLRVRHTHGAQGDVLGREVQLLP